MNEENTNTNEELDLDRLFDDVFTLDQPADAPAEQPAQGSDTEAETPEVHEERSRNAERRVRREQRIADEARNAERARLNELIKSIVIERNDGSTIQSVEELEAYEKQASDDRIAQGRATAEDIRRIAAEVMQPPADGNAEVQRQLDMIRDMDPEMTDLGAILNSDIGADFRAAVDSGKTFVQAYGQALRLKAAKDKGAAESAVAKAVGKQHLSATNQRGSGALDVPADEMALYKELNPEMTEKEIQAHYNKYRKQTG